MIGFIRLRLNYETDNTKIIPVLSTSALIRELHVYSNLSNVGENNDNSHQHKGFGKSLVLKAEEIAKQNNFNKIAIIAGTGVRNYYKKLGYSLIDTFMVKEI